MVDDDLLWLVVVEREGGTNATSCVRRVLSPTGAARQDTQVAHAHHCCGEIKGLYSLCVGENWNNR